jgi:hypothetical protein
MLTARLTYRSITLATALLATSVAWAQTELKNDSFVDGGAVSFMGGFTVGEIGASRFIPAGPCTITKIQLLFGGAATTQTATLHIYDDSGQATNPGSELMTATDVQLTGSNSALSEIDVTALGTISAPGPFRVGFEWQHTGTPSIASDTDGMGYTDRNFVYSTGAWTTSQIYGVSGDWIIRAFVVYPGQDAGVQEDAAVQLDAAAQSDAAVQSDAGTQQDGGGCSLAAPGARPVGLVVALALVGVAGGLLRRRRRP